MARAAQEIGGQRMIGAREGSIGNPVAVYIAVAFKFAGFFKTRFIQDFASIKGFAGNFELIARPEIHSQIQIAQDKNGGL